MMMITEKLNQTRVHSLSLQNSTAFCKH